MPKNNDIRIVAHKLIYRQNKTQNTKHKITKRSRFIYKLIEKHKGDCSDKKQVISELI